MSNNEKIKALEKEIHRHKEQLKDDLDLDYHEPVIEQYRQKIKELSSKQ